MPLAFEPLTSQILESALEDQIIVALKAVKTLNPEHSAQTLNYLKSTGKPVAMVINFGSPKLEYRRFGNRFKKSL